MNVDDTSLNQKAEPASPISSISSSAAGVDLATVEITRLEFKPPSTEVMSLLETLANISSEFEKQLGIGNASPSSSRHLKPTAREIHSELLSSPMYQRLINDLATAMQFQQVVYIAVIEKVKTP